MSENSTISISYKFKGDLSGLKDCVKEVEKMQQAFRAGLQPAEELKTSLINFSALTTGLNAVTSAVNQISGSLSSLTAESENFNKTMRATNTMAGKDESGFRKLKEDVAELAKEIPMARDLLANGLYQTISNGVPEDNWMEFLKTSARSAVGGLADLEKVVGVTSTVIKNYGLSWEDAASIQDKIQLTAKNGVTSFEQLAAALPRVTGNAATLGVSINELMGTFATLTGVSGNTAEVSTQLAAIFTSLVKPSSEAAKMAAEMGIQFDAAAIKAAGGFQNFLQDLDASVKAYVASTGMLEQEVYGKLFGSAEALRALIPLQGELADRFTGNIAAMKDSAGTMDDAFAGMSSTGEAVNQMLKNQWATVTDLIASVTSGVQPYLNFASGILGSASSVIILIQGFKTLNVQQALAAVRARLAGSAIATSLRIADVQMKGNITTVTMLGRTMTATGVAGKVMGHTIRAACWTVKAALISTGIGAIIWGIGEAVSWVTEKLGGMGKAAKEAGEEMAKISDAQLETERVLKSSTAQLELHIARLKDFKGSKEEEKSLIEELNSTYGKSMGTFNSLAEWYKVLRRNSEAYCKQMVLEAEARMLADQIAARSANLRKANEEESKLLPSFFQPSNAMEQAQLEQANWIREANKKVYGPIRQQLEEDQAELAKLIQQSADIGAQMMSPVSTPKQGAEDSGKKTKSAKTSTALAPEGTEKWYEDQIKELKTKISVEQDPEAIMRMDREVNRLQHELNSRRLFIRINEKYGDLDADGNRQLNGLENLKRETGRIFKELERTPLMVDLKVRVPNSIPGVEKLHKAAMKAFGEELQKRIDESKKQMQDLSGIIGQCGQAFSSLGQAFEEPVLNVVGIIAQAIANMVLSYSNALGQAGKMGPLGWAAFGAAGLAQLTAMIAQVKNISKFAAGGIVSGPTMALVGEYAGASRNPEVIAPLDKLQSIIGSTGGTQHIVVSGEARLRGRDIVISMSNTKNIGSASGHRYRP